MNIFKIFEKHPKYHFKNILGPFFGQILKKEVKNWRGTLAIKTKNSQKIFCF